MFVLGRIVSRQNRFVKVSTDIGLIKVEQPNAFYKVGIWVILKKTSKRWYVIAGTNCKENAYRLFALYRSGKFGFDERLHDKIRKEKY